MMDALKRFGHSISFTPAERRVAWFLAAAFVVGIAVKFYRVATDEGPGFDYTTSDAEFRRLSAAAEGIPDSAARQTLSGASLTDSTRRKEHHPSGGKKEPLAGSVNINTARREELMRLPGIGETMAERILAYRKEHGPFTSVEDLMNVKGIGKKKFARIAPACTTGR